MCSWHWRRFEIPHSSSCKILFVLGVVWGFLVDTVILLSCYQPCKVWFSYRGAERVTAPNGLFAVSELWINALIPSPQFLASSMFCQCRLQEDPTFLQHLIYQVVDQVPSKFWLKGRIGWWPWIALTLCWVSLASLKQWNLSDLFFSASLNQELFIWIYICWHVIKHFPQTLNPIYLEQCSVHENSCKFFSLYFHVVQHHVCIWRLQQPPPEWHPEVHTWEMWGFWQRDVLPAGRSWCQVCVDSPPSSLRPLGKCNSGAAAKGLWRLSSQARYVPHSSCSLFWKVCRLFFSFQILSCIN